MQTVTVEINIDSPTGRRLLKEIQKHPKVAKVDFPENTELTEQKTYSVEEVFSKVEEKLNNHYGSKLKLKY